MNINNNFSKFMTLADKVSDYVPLVSTLSNCVDIFEKYALLPLMSKERIEASHYFNHLNQKSYTRCAIFSLPILGFIINGLCDYYKECDRTYNNEEWLLVNLKYILLANPRFKNDKNFALKVFKLDAPVKESDDEFTKIINRNKFFNLIVYSDFLSDNLKLDKEVILALVETYRDSALKFCNELKKNKNIEIVSFKDYCLELCNDGICNHLRKININVSKDFAVEIVKIAPWIFFSLNTELQMDETVKRETQTALGKIKAENPGFDPKNEIDLNGNPHRISIV